MSALERLRDAIGGLDEVAAPGEEGYYEDAHQIGIAIGPDNAVSDTGPSDMLPLWYNGSESVITLGDLRAICAMTLS